MRKNVTVVAEMRNSGKIIPLYILWENGKRFEIDKVLDVRLRASTKGGGVGLRYLVRIGQNERFLFLDGIIWFVEV